MRWPLAWALATALLLVLAAPGPVSVLSPWPALLAWVALAPVLVALEGQRVRSAAAIGCAAGLAANLGLYPWFPGLVARFSGLNPALAVGLFLALMAWQALGWALWAALVRWCAAAPARLPLALVAPAAFVAIERWWPVVFPASIGLTQYRHLAVAQAAELGGPAVVTFLLVLVGAALAALVAAVRARRRVPWPTLAAAGAAVVAAVVFGHVRLSSVAAARAAAPAIRVGMIQPDAVRAGWSRGERDDPADALERYQRATAALEAATAARPLDLLLWPEKGYPLVLRRDARRDAAGSSARRVRRGFAGPLIFGLTSVDPATREIGNSAAFLDRDGALEVFYDKVELILYSEWLPRWAATLGGGGLRYRPGTRLAPLVVELEPREGGPPGGRVTISAFICFEATFPAHVRSLVARGGPHLLVNLTDDGWFGDTAEPEQHLSHVVFRAIESRRDVARATATGVSALVAATGAIERRSRVSLARADGALVVEPRLLTLRGAHARLGDGFAAACALLGAIAAALAWSSTRLRWRAGRFPVSWPRDGGVR